MKPCVGHAVVLLKENFKNLDGYILSDVIFLNKSCHPLWLKQGLPEEKPRLQREISQSVFSNLNFNIVYGSPVMIHIPPSLTRLRVLLVRSINRVQESLPEFVLVFC